MNLMTDTKLSVIKYWIYLLKTKRKSDSKIIITIYSVLFIINVIDLNFMYCTLNLILSILLLSVIAMLEHLFEYIDKYGLKEFSKSKGEKI